MDVFFSEWFSLYCNVAAVIGAVYLLRILSRGLWELANAFRAYFLAPWGVSRKNLRKYGSWAIVTGASEGIGRGYALELARQGLNVAILSRSEEKLNSVASVIRDRYNREVRVIPVDFSDGQSVYADIQAEISDLDVAVLVNNVGLSLKYPEYFNNVSKKRHRDMIELNCQSMVQMTHLVLPKMVERGTGVIVNISSHASLNLTPLLSVYSASKMFVNHFSAALHREYSNTGVTVQLVVPSLVKTTMTHAYHATSSNLSVSPEDFACSAVATIGIQQHTSGCFSHALQCLSFSLFPKWLFTYAVFHSLVRIRHLAVTDQK